MSIDRLKANFAIDVRWVFFPLHPDTPPEGMSLEDLFPGRDLTPFRQRMQGLMREAGLAYGERTHTYNSRLAQELAKWAESKLDGEALDGLHRSLYEAYFVSGSNIGNIEVLVNIAQESGLDASEARAILESRSFEKQIDADWEQAVQSGVTGVPTFVAQELVVVGCQPYEILEKFMLHLQAPRKENKQKDFS